MIQRSVVAGYWLWGAGFLPVWVVPWLRCVAASPGALGSASAPTAPGRLLSVVAGTVAAGQLGAGRAQIRCQQVVKASFQGQVALILSTRLRACRTSRAGRCSSR